MATKKNAQDSSLRIRPFEVPRAVILPIFTKPRNVIAKIKMLVDGSQVTAKVTNNANVCNAWEKELKATGPTLGFYFKYDEEWHRMHIQRKAKRGLAISHIHHSGGDEKAFDKSFRRQEKYFVELAAAIAKEHKVKI